MGGYYRDADGNDIRDWDFSTTSQLLRTAAESAV